MSSVRIFSTHLKKSADILLNSPGGELQCSGHTVSHKGKTHPFTAYVTKGHSVNNLLSRPLLVKMNVVKRVDETVCNRTLKSIW